MINKIISLLKTIRRQFILNCLNKKGWKTDRHLIVIESDDWGSIRMPSREVYESLIAGGDTADKDAFLKNDSLESEKDLSNLYHTFEKINEKYCKLPVITANFAMANPDFEQIDLNNPVYRYEPFYKTYDNNNNSDNTVGTLIYGIEKGYIFPQLHCREHLNVTRWIRDINNHKADTICAFDNHMIGIGASFTAENKFGYMDSFNYNDDSELYFLKNSIRDAVEMFKRFFSYDSKSFVASCFVWDEEIERELSENGIRFIQTSFTQNVPTEKEGTLEFKYKKHYMGEKNALGQIYTVRNCSYEPAYRNNPEQAANNCFLQIKNAFRNKKPAIINSHRFNYISRINKLNAKANLDGLYNLLSRCIDCYNDVEFITTVDLGEMILNDKDLE